MSIDDMVKIINDTKDAVDRSAFGPMFIYTDDLDPMKKSANQLAFNVFLTVLAVNIRNKKEEI